MHILLTRPLTDCSEMILKFKSLGHQVSHLPLLNIKKMKHEEIMVLFCSSLQFVFWAQFLTQKNSMNVGNNDSLLFVFIHLQK